MHALFYLKDFGAVFKGVRVADIIDQADNVAGQIGIRQVVEVGEHFMKLRGEYRLLQIYSGQNFKKSLKYSLLEDIQWLLLVYRCRSTASHSGSKPDCSITVLVLQLSKSADRNGISLWRDRGESLSFLQRQTTSGYIKERR